MTRAIRSLNKGRARVWWVHHGREAIRAAQLTTLVACFIAVSSFDYQDQLEQERAAHAAVRQQLDEERAARGMPRTAWIIDATTPRKASERLAEIAGDLDAWRYRNREAK